jgi:hypothetical protein
LTVSGITANNKVYDASTSATLDMDSASLVGVISGDSVTLNAGAATGVFNNKNVGTGKTITLGGLSLSGADAGDYSLSQPSAMADITKALLTVTADNKSRAAGQSNPTLTASYAGFVGGETLATSGVTGSPALSATNSNVVGTYPITAALGTLSAANYAFTFGNGTLTVTAGAANKLVMLTQPAATATAGVAFAQQPQIRIEDQYGNLRSSDNTTVVTAVRNVGSGTLQGTLTATAVNGVATFANLSHNVANNINLNFTSSSLTSTTSGNILIGAGPFAKLQLLVPGETAAPGTVSGKTGTPIAQTADIPFTVSVNAVDNYWNPLSAPADTVGITASDSFATLPANAPLISGERDFLLTLSIAGSATITATDLTDGSKAPNTSPSIPVVAAQHIAATGGGAISADTVGGSWTTLTGPVYSEAASGNVGIGTIILNAPNGFIFDTGGTAPTVLITRLTGSGFSANNINNVSSGTAAAITSRTTNQITFTVTDFSVSGVTCSLTWQNLRVRPLAGSPLASGKLSRSGTASVVALTTNSNLGSFREVAGAASKLAIATQPSVTATAGMAFTEQPMLRVEDKFGNLRDAANGTPDNATIVTASRNAGSGVLQGTLTAKATDGVATFTNLSHQVATNITITFASGSLTNTTSGIIAVSPAAADRLVFVTQPGNGSVGAPLAAQPILRSRDPFGNDSCVGIGTSWNVTLSLSAGTGSLLGTTLKDIGTGAGNGLAVWVDLAVDSAGTKQLTASASGLASAVSSTFSVSKTTQTIAFDPLANKTYGNSPFTLSASASSALPVTFSIVSGPANLAGNVMTITGVGTVTVRALQAGDDYWAAATPVDRSFTVAKATLTVTADNKSRLYGATNPTFTVSYSGFVNGDNMGDISGSPALTTAASVTSSVAGNPYPINIGAGTLASANYNFALVPGTLTIAPAPLSVVANDASRVYGQANPALTGTLTGLKNGDTITASYTTTATAGSPAGAYDIVPGLSDPNGKLINYEMTTANGILTVGKATLTVTVQNASRVFGAPNPTFAASFSGFVNGDNQGALAGSPDFTTTATAGSSVAGSPYVINASQGTLAAANYNFVFVAAQLTVTSAFSANAVTSSANPSPTGSNVTFTATLSPVSPSLGTPSGTVRFIIDGAPHGSPVGLVGGVAALTLATLTHGTHTISAEYVGDGNFLSSTNGLGSSQVINAAPIAGLAIYSRASNEWVEISVPEFMTTHVSDADGDPLDLVSVGSGTNGATVFVFGDSIYYLPSNSNPNRNTTDHLSYVVTDGFLGGTVTNSIHIRLDSMDPGLPAVLTGIVAAGANTYLTFTGSPGYTYWIQRTASLQDAATVWEDLGNATTDGSGGAAYTDSNPLPGNGFYRAVWR